MLEKGVTAEVLAEKIGMSKTAFSKRLNSLIPFKDHELFKLKTELSLTLDELNNIFLTF